MSNGNEFILTFADNWKFYSSCQFIIDPRGLRFEEFEHMLKSMYGPNVQLHDLKFYYFKKAYCGDRYDNMNDLINHINSCLTRREENFTVLTIMRNNSRSNRSKHDDRLKYTLYLTYKYDTVVLKLDHPILAKKIQEVPHLDIFEGIIRRSFPELRESTCSDYFIVERREGISTRSIYDAYNALKDVESSLRNCKKAYLAIVPVAIEIFSTIRPNEANDIITEDVLNNSNVNDFTYPPEKKGFFERLND